MKNKIILNIEKPWIDCYTSYSHLLSILQCDERTYGWIFSHFINLYMNNDLRRNPWGDFYKPFPYELTFYEICKWLDLQKVRRSNVVVDRDRERVLDFVINELKNGYYVHLHIEHKSIKSFDTNNHVHDALIYGIDIDKNIVYAQDVFLQGRLDRKELTVDEFLDSVFDTDVPFDGDYMKGSIYSYKIRDNCDYEIHKMNILNSLAEYMHSNVTEYWKLYNVADDERINSGLEIYAPLIDYVDKYEVGEVLDIRPYYVLRDHCSICKKAIEYIKEDLKENIENYEEVIKQYDELIEIAQNVTLQILIVKKTGNRKKKDKMISLLSEMKEKEISIGKLIGIL